MLMSKHFALNPLTVAPEMHMIYIQTTWVQLHKFPKSTLKPEESTNKEKALPTLPLSSKERETTFLKLCTKRKHALMHCSTTI